MFDRVKNQKKITSVLTIRGEACVVRLNLEFRPLATLLQKCVRVNTFFNPHTFLGRFSSASDIPRHGKVLCVDGHFNLEGGLVMFKDEQKKIFQVPYEGLTRAHRFCEVTS